MKEVKRKRKPVPIPVKAEPYIITPTGERLPLVELKDLPMPPTQERLELKKKLRILIETLPVRKQDYEKFGFGSSAEFRAEVNTLIEML